MAEETITDLADLGEAAVEAPKPLPEPEIEARLAEVAPGR